MMAAIVTGREPPSTYFEQASELALAPVGGLWRDREVFVVGWRPDERDVDGERWVRDTFGAVLDMQGERRELA